MSESRIPWAKSRARGSLAVHAGWADVAQLVEHSLGKGEVTSSILVIGSMDMRVARKTQQAASVTSRSRAGVTQW